MLYLAFYETEIFYSEKYHKFICSQRWVILMMLCSWTKELISLKCEWVACSVHEKKSQQSPLIRKDAILWEASVTER